MYITSSSYVNHPDNRALCSKGKFPENSLPVSLFPTSNRSLTYKQNKARQNRGNKRKFDNMLIIRNVQIGRDYKVIDNTPASRRKYSSKASGVQ